MSRQIMCHDRTFGDSESTRGATMHVLPPGRMAFNDSLKGNSCLEQRHTLKDLN